ncbi:MAG: FAD-dependent oxidoreductase [Clostridiales bacterium]|nr:FAD-dependent oxidoreductase [Clostridiales bacterium]
MKILIIGGVAAGTKAAAKLKRCNKSAEVKILTKSQGISYAGCGLPYYVGGDIEDIGTLAVNTPASFKALTGAEVVTGCEVTAVDPKAKSVSYKLADGSVGNEAYDKLIIASGAQPFVPDIDGVSLDGVFTVRTPDDAAAIRDYIEKNNCKKAVVCGAGFIGLEMAENLLSRGLNVTVVEMADTILPGVFDTDMSGYIKRQLQSASMRILNGTAVRAVTRDTAASGVVTDSGNIPADIVILAIGVRPSTAFLDGSGIETIKGAVVVDEGLRTNIEDIYAAGDCAIVKNKVSGARQWSAMGSTANISARVLAKRLNGADDSYTGCLGTGIVKLLPSLNAGRTGLTEADAKAAGFDAVSALCVVDDKAKYYPDSSSVIIKLVADRATNKLIGAEVIGSNSVDKMIDIAATGISLGATVDSFDTMDFAYAPPFSTAISPFVTACYVLENKLAGELESFTPAEYAQGAARGYTIIDVHPAAKITGTKWVNLTSPEKDMDGIPTDAKLLIVCNRGRRAYLLQNKLKQLGYTATKVLEGGSTFNQVKAERIGSKLPESEIKRVKGLGCLRDKRFDDVFNVRVITRNGKITAEESKIIAEAAEKYGSGEVAMTTRLTIEIQGVPYDNLDELFAFLADNGLETGGTGSKVRPVVSCKGTTCQFGLIDTFGLSEKIHEIFYKGYHDMTLPHKFKIAVGGCPNNCVKPDLNDLGIIGQRLPSIDLTKCRGCKVCQIEKKCPIKTAQLVDGKITIDTEACNHCGRCVDQCPFGAVTEERVGYKITIGGRWGKKTAFGRPLSKIFASEEEVLDAVDRAILLFRDEGITGERFADTVARLGFEYVEDKLLNGKIDKAEILKKSVTGGATC